MPQSIRALNWNVEWATPRSTRGSLIQQRFQETNPDLICLTEGQADLLPASGHIITSRADTGYRTQKPLRRKVLLWSQSPWENVDDLGSEELPSGRYITGTTKTAIGSLRVIGVCISWSHAHVSTGRKDRSPWEEHLQYLQVVRDVLSEFTDDCPSILIGDFNQRIPRSRAPKDVYQSLLDTLEDWTIATEGLIAGLDLQVIDHVATNNLLCCETVEGLSRHTQYGLRLSDHDAVQVVLSPNNEIEKQD